MTASSESDTIRIVGSPLRQEECDAPCSAQAWTPALLWDAVATKNAKLLSQGISSLPDKLERATWLNYARCHDDIGLGFDDGDIAAVGYEPAAHRRFLLSLLGLAILLSLAVYGTTRHLGQRLGNRIAALAGAITLDDDNEEAMPLNELSRLSQRIEALPMDLLRTRSEVAPRDENYRTTAVLYLHLTSLSGYVDTLDEQSLHRYTDRLHQVVYAAAGFYAGELQVARQFGLAVYFSGPNSAGSAAFRAASCAWLVQAASRALQEQIPLSMNIAMAISQSELGVGDGSDIYPGLYMQHTLDELQAICASKPPKILLSPAVCEDMDVAGRLQHQETEVSDYAMLEEFAGPYRDLLERQLRLILNRLSDPSRL